MKIVIDVDFSWKSGNSQSVTCTFLAQKAMMDSERRRKNMDQQKVGQFLKTLRSEKSITQAEVAEVLGVSNRSISRWENGTTMPDFDLLIELAKYYEVEVGEILDGERKDKDMDSKTEEVMLKIADYNNVEQNFFSRRMCIMFMIALAGMAIYAVIDLAGLAGAEPYETIVSIALGFVVGTLLIGFLYASRYIAKLKAAKIRLKKELRRLK